MRYFEITVTSHNWVPVPNTPRSVRSAHAKIGEVAVIWFRRIFGRPADQQIWAAKGFMAEARDRRGNRVMVQQINDDDLPGFDPRSGTFPLALRPQS